ncbi:MAG: Calx-beta domain-containing protein, partial [Flavobacteriaceae bacterium]
SGNTVTINLSDHTQVGTQNGMFGTLNSASIDEQIAIVTMTMSPQCNFRSNTGTTYEITGKSPCGANATGSGSRLSSNPIILTGAEPPYSTNNITLNTPTINGCDNGSIEVETHIVDGVTGNSDFTRITLPAGLLYTTGSFASTGTVAATLQSTDIVNGKQEIEITLPSGVSNTDTISYEFDVESSADICAGTHEIDLSTFVTVTGLSCNGTACGEIEVVTGEATTSIDIEKGQLEEDDTFTHTATYFQSGGDTTYSLNFGIENTGTEDLGPNLEYNVYCADASGVATGSSLYTGTITSVIAAGGTFEENASFTTSNFCGDDANMVVEFEPGTANCFCTELLIGITSEETTDFGSVDFVDDDITVNEADGTATIEVVFTGNVPGGFTLDFASADNTTTVGSDYVGVNSSLTFSGTDGEIVPITIFILDDDLIESIENLFVNLSNPSSPLVTIVDDQATVNITGNETDEDNDNIADVVDLDDDNDGILDSNEAVACIDDDYFNWGFNSPSGTRSVDFVQNPAITDWMISNTDDIVVGAGLTGTSPGSELEITGLGETTYLGAIEEDDYIEMSFTTGTDLVDPIIERMGVNWFQNSNGRGHSYDAAIAISKDDFATSSLLNADVRINYPSNGVSEFFDLTASGITYKLEENTTYTVRFYAYNQQTDGTLPHSVFDDFTIRVSSCQAQDSDNDTVPDHLDEDSDDDGCVDAIEAGHTDPDDDGELGNATVTVDSNGQVTGQGGYTGTNTHVTTPFVAVTFDSQPTDEVSNTGDTVSFTATVSGGATVSYQWQESTDSGTSWSDITDGGIYSGATTNTLTLTGVSGTQHNNDYRLVVTSSDNNCSTYNSASANLFVNTTEICNDGADNDGDGLVDCDDPDCYLAANSGDIDTDGDGIGDSCDLDRDNDGILNEEECAVNVTLQMAGNPTTLNGTPLTAQESVSPGDVIEITNAGVLADGTNLVVRIVIEDIVTGPAFDPSGGETGAFYDPTSGSIAIEQFDPTNDSHVKFYIEVLDSNTNTPLTIYGEGIFKDIDSQAGRDFTEVLGIGHGLSATLGQNLSAVTYVNGNGPGTDQTYFGQNPANAGDPNNWTDEENNNANTVENWATVSYRFVNRLHLSYGVTGSQLGFNPNGNRALSLTDFTIREYCDTDNDGRPDVI